MTWALIGYFSSKIKQLKVAAQTKNDIDNVDKNNFPYIQSSIESIITKLERSKPKSAERELLKLQDTEPKYKPLRTARFQALSATSTSVDDSKLGGYQRKVDRSD
jgi:hypothetical protein